MFLSRDKYLLVAENTVEYQARNGEDKYYIFTRDPPNKKLARCYKIYTRNTHGKKLYYCSNYLSLKCRGRILVTIADGKVYKPKENKHLSSCKAANYEYFLSSQLDRNVIFLYI